MLSENLDSLSHEQCTRHLMHIVLPYEENKQDENIAQERTSPVWNFVWDSGLSQSPGERAGRASGSRRLGEERRTLVSESCALGTLTPPAPGDITVGNKDIRVQAAEISGRSSEF